MSSRACSGCGSVYSRSAWLRLRTLAVISATDVRTHVVRWDVATVICVRECRTCGAPMARTERAGRGADA